jgi:hypothetical protein
MSNDKLIKEFESLKAMADEISHRSGKAIAGLKANDSTSTITRKGLSAKASAELVMNSKKRRGIR